MTRKDPTLLVATWPAQVPRPCEAPCVIQLHHSGPKTAQRASIRKVLQEVLQSWDCTLPWKETPQGPIHPQYTISVSYTATSVWLALHTSSKLGIDAVFTANFPELISVSQTYLGPSATQNIFSHIHPAKAFARAWTVLESNLKAHRQGLSEFPQQLPQLEHTVSWDTTEGITITVCWSQQ